MHTSRDEFLSSSSKGWLKNNIIVATVRKDQEQFSLFVYLSLVLLHTITFIVYGVFGSDSTTVISGFQVLFTTSSLIVAFTYSLICEQVSITQRFTFGTERVHVIACFYISTALLLTATFQIFEGIHRLFSVEALHNNELEVFDFTLWYPHFDFSLISITITRIIGLFLFWPKIDVYSVFSLSPAPTSGTLLSNAIFLHICSDLICSLASEVAMHSPWFSGISSAIPMGISGVIIAFLVFPLFRVTGLILLQTSPSHSQAIMQRHLREISAHHNVVEVILLNWWTLRPGNIVATLRVRVRKDADEHEILEFIDSLLSKCVHQLTVQIEKYGGVGMMLR